MRWVFIAVAVLSACGDRSVATIQATGLQTPAIETTRSPRDVVACTSDHLKTRGRTLALLCAAH
jgi:hypothetical protein